MSIKTLCSWSGGKDSCFALMTAISEGYNPVVLLNMMNENGKVSRSHGLSTFLLDQQAKVIGLPIKKVPASWDEYEGKYIEALKELTEKYKLQAAVYGDIDLQPHREWEEKVCKAAGIEAILPIWQQNRKELVLKMINSGVKAIIVSCNTTMGEKYLGMEITEALVDELESMGVDACGENGEYHTVVLDCPLFSKSIELAKYTKKTYNEYCFLTWES